MAATVTSFSTAQLGGNSPAILGTYSANAGDWLLLLLSASNDGTSGATSYSSVSVATAGGGTVDIVDRANILYDPGAAGAGANLILVTVEILTTVTNGSLQVNWVGGTAPSQGVSQIWRVEPGASEEISFIAVDTTGSTGNASTYSAATVSVTNGDIIFGAAAIETDDAITGDTDTTNGNWSAVVTRLHDTGADAACMTCSSQHKTVTATGNQDWACTSATARDSARTYIVLRSATSVQALTPGLVTNTQTFYAPVVAGPVIAGLVTNDQTFYAPTVSATYSLTPGLFTNDQTFHAPTVSATYSLTPGLFTNDQTFYAPTVSATYDLTPGLVTNTQTFYAPTVAAAGEAQNLDPGLVTNAQTFHSPTVSATYDLTPGLVTNAQSFFAPTVLSLYDLQPGLVTNTQAFHAPSVASSYELLPGLVTNAQVFYSPTMTGGDVEAEAVRQQGFTRRRSKKRGGRRG